MSRAITHQVTIALLDHIAEMNAYAKDDAAVLWHARVAFDHGALDFDRKADGVDHAAELDDAAIASALDDPAAMRVDRRIDQVASQPPQSRQGSPLVGSGETAVADDVGDKDRGELAGLDHRASQMPPHDANSTKTWSAMLFPRVIRRGKMTP